MLGEPGTGEITSQPEPIIKSGGAITEATTGGATQELHSPATQVTPSELLGIDSAEPFVRRDRPVIEGQATQSAIDTDLLDKLRDVRTPSDLLKPFTESFPLGSQEREAARRANTDRAIALIRFYKDQGVNGYPTPGRNSSARMAFGPHAPAWNSTETDFFIEELKHRNLITDEQVEELRGKTADGTPTASVPTESAPVLPQPIVADTPTS